MKKIFLLFLVFTFINLFSQEYHFDYSIESQTTKTKPNKEKSISTSFYDSKNKIHLHIDKYNDKMRAVIYDKDKNLRHSFKVTESKGFVTFQYTHTNDFSKHKNKDIAKDDVLEVKKIDSLQYQIIAFKNEKRNKKRFTALVTLEKSKLNYLEIGVDHAQSDEMEQKVRKFLDLNSNYILKRMQVDYSTGYSYDSSLKIKNVDFSLKLPEKLIIKEFDFIGEFQD
ncbi:hypothetical protein QFZ37_003527 [Chryseobacterium ginsenosidimutans]|uniref:hypothetical protein n=1 Tax=Chryseobacterium ginsenosidimutans TaxID=687846 RepID=UPI00278299DB|nr:hypothetical protein [Chryseobacterium ginsenosidimutans]MDQ0595158.1 hypothetical protein [Chryseobacterium ginsenosidimutans]